MRFLSSILLLFNAVAPPATLGGIYLNPEQFSRHTVSCPFDCQTDKFRLNNFLGGANIQVICHGEKHSFAKDTIFGYRDCKGLDYRFYQKAPYRILDTTGFLLYSYTRLEQNSKIAHPATAYYFSIQPTTPILPLTITNLQKAYSSNPTFCYKLSAGFHSDADLLTWLPAAKTYKLKYAYVQSTL